jgi:hypothetical protein
MTTAVLNESFNVENRMTIWRIKLAKNAYPPPTPTARQPKNHQLQYSHQLNSQ